MADHPSASQPSTAEVRMQRDRIVASKTFALSSRLRTFLTFIVDAALEDRADRLKEFTLGIEVFERDESFDPSIDSIVRVEASRLRSKLREYYDVEGQDDRIRIDIPKGHYIPTFHFFDPVAAIKDSKKELEVGYSASRNIWTSRNHVFAGIGVLAVAILYIVVENYLPDREPLEPTREIYDQSVAVLPFVSLSSGEDDGYFADGLTEEILNSLTHLPELKVTARTSSFYFKGQNLLVSDIASRLRVANIVEGSVRRDGDRLRITTQLIRAADNFHLWSHTYDLTIDDVFAVQEAIAARVAEVLGVVLDDAAREVMRGSGINDVEAFIAYQKGREAYLYAHRGENRSGALEIANAYFEQALEAAPGLAMARLMKADLRGHIVFEIAIGIRDEAYPGELQETLAALREEYDLAIKLSPAGNQRDILNLERTLFGEEWTALPRRMKKAMQPGTCPQMNWTVAITQFGWAEPLVAKFQEAIACNPLDTSASYQLAWSLIWAGDADAALRVIEEADAKGLSHPFLDDGRFWALLAMGRVEDPRTRGPGMDGSNMAYDRQIWRQASAGNSANARQLANDYWSGSDTNDLATLTIAAIIGDRDRANAAAARIDAHPGSATVLSSATYTCFCGALFDLDATPNYRARIDEAGFSWPPPKRIHFPEKTW